MYGSHFRMNDYYYILGVDEGASDQDIKIAFRKLSAKFHPDKNPDDEFFEKMFKNINEAYEILSDDRKRRSYDLKRRHGGRTKRTNTDRTPKIISFSVNREIINIGEPIILSWKVKNAAKVYLTGISGAFPSKGTKTVLVRKGKERNVKMTLTAVGTTGIKRHISLHVFCRDSFSFLRTFRHKIIAVFFTLFVIVVFFIIGVIIFDVVKRLIIK